MAKFARPLIIAYSKNSCNFEPGIYAKEHRSEVYK
jgi:hypothetical protein